MYCLAVFIDITVIVDITKKEKVLVESAMYHRKFLGCKDVTTPEIISTIQLKTESSVV